MVNWFFSKRKEKANETYEERLQAMEDKYRKLNSTVLDVATDVDNLRNKVLRKIQERREQYEKDINTESSENDTSLPRMRRRWGGGLRKP